MLQHPTTTVFDDDFPDGLDLGGRWQLLAGPGVQIDDGIPENAARGFTVAPPGRNPVTQEPAFSKDIPGPLCHLKWMATTTAAFPTAGGTLRVSYRAGATSYGVAGHPYGDAVSDPDSDMRLGAATLNLLDFQSGMILDFWITNTAVYTLYERMHQPGDDHPEAYAVLNGPFPRTPGRVQDFCITVDTGAGTVRWELDGATVATVDRIGPSDPTWWTCYHHGGTPRDAVPAQFQVALGMLTLLDAAWPPNDQGLVDFGNPLTAPRSFRGGPALFGQGVRLDVERVTVELVERA